MPGLDALAGQEDMVRALRRDLAAGRRAHAYLFEGQAGTGRLAMARAWAAENWCQDPAGGGCGTCRPCRLLAQGRHPDYCELPRGRREIGLAHFSGEAAATRSDPVDHPPVLPFLRMRPVEAPFRVVVVPDAERLRGEPANAFLKTLEEPPGGALILLTAGARDRLPATVVSRCRRVPVRPLPGGLLAAELRRRAPPDRTDADLADLAALAEGSLGFALALLGDGGALEEWRWLSRAFGEVLERPGDARAYALARGLAARLPPAGAGGQAPRRVAAAALLDRCVLWLRGTLRDRRTDPRAAWRALEAAANAGLRLSANVNPELTLVSAGLEMASAFQET